MSAGPPVDAPGPTVGVDVLGPLRLVVDATAVDVPGPKRRALLALLTLAEGRAVSVDDLVDGLWPSRPPDSARATLHSHVSRLRRHLGPAAARLEGLTGAYRLLLDHDATDEARARALLTAAGDAMPADARRLLGEARALWRGPALAEFADVAPLAAWAVALDELRRSVEEAYATAALEAGDASEAVELAATLVEAEPVAESPVLLLMRALAATGRSAEALRAAHDYRRRLASEAGLDPSPAVADVERDIVGSTTTRPRAVPRSPNPLRGRDSELAALHRLLAHERLVTVLGPGGVGKTRLAAEIAMRADDVTTLLLASVTEVGAIPHALAAALDLNVIHGDILSACAALLAAGPQLLVVDNCEHLLPRIADVVGALLDACPQLTVLATSREPLALPAEQRLRLAPLPVTSAHDLDDLTRSPAVGVFVDRARRVRPGFAPSVDELSLVTEVVRRLDGMPLAIELAAGRLSSLEVADLHARLDRALDLLGDGRHVTLRGVIEWSYSLLPEHERRLFRHLGVFPDGFALSTAELVATRLDLGSDAGGAVAHLVDASMIEVSFGPRPRYRMLDAVRRFARDCLAAEGEDEDAAGHFLAWAVDLAAWVDRTVATHDEPRADSVLRDELANLRAAWQLIRERERLDDAVRMVVGLGDAAGWRDLTEVWDWTQELADDAGIDMHPEGPAVLGIAAATAWARGELDRAHDLACRGLEVAGDGRWRGHAALALVALSRGDVRGAVHHGEQAASESPQAEQSLGVAALAAAYHGELEQATELHDRASTVPASPSITGFRHYVAAEIDALAGRTERAEQHYEQAIALARQSGATFGEGIASVGLLSLRADAGRVVEALDGYRDLVDYWERTGGWIQEWTTLRNLARLLRSLGDNGTATLLEAAADRAPDAPAVAHGDTASSGDGGPSRAEVLGIARQAIDTHRAGAPPASTGAV